MTLVFPSVDLFTCRFVAMRRPTRMDGRLLVLALGTFAIGTDIFAGILPAGGRLARCHPSPSLCHQRSAVAHWPLWSLDTAEPNITWSRR